MYLFTITANLSRSHTNNMTSQIPSGGIASTCALSRFVTNKQRTHQLPICRNWRISLFLLPTPLLPLSCRCHTRKPTLYWAPCYADPDFPYRAAWWMPTILSIKYLLLNVDPWSPITMSLCRNVYLTTTKCLVENLLHCALVTSAI